MGSHLVVGTSDTAPGVWSNHAGYTSWSYRHQDSLSFDDIVSIKGYCEHTGFQDGFRHTAFGSRLLNPFHPSFLTGEPYRLYAAAFAAGAAAQESPRIGPIEGFKDFLANRRQADAAVPAERLAEAHLQTALTARQALDAQSLTVQTLSSERLALFYAAWYATDE